MIRSPLAGLVKLDRGRVRRRTSRKQRSMTLVVRTLRQCAWGTVKKLSSSRRPVLIFRRELTAWPAAHRLLLQPGGLYSGGEFAGTKVLSWVHNAATIEKVHSQGYDDALLVTKKRQLVECTSANNKAST